MKTIKSFSLALLVLLAISNAPIAAMEVDASPDFNFDNLNTAVIAAYHSGMAQVADAAHAVGNSVRNISSKVLSEVHSSGKTISNELSKVATTSVEAIKEELPAALKPAKPTFMEHIKVGILVLKGAAKEHPYIAGTIAAAVTTIPLYFLIKKAFCKKKA